MQRAKVTKNSINTMLTQICNLYIRTKTTIYTTIFICMDFLNSAMDEEVDTSVHKEFHSDSSTQRVPLR